MVLVPVSAVLVASTTSNLDAKLPLPLLNQILSWLVFGVAVAVLFIPLRQHSLALLVKVYLCIGIV